ncbi:MAG: hypothetical protein FJY67_02520 [Calditrichaeota bacterium]|nr:hypothetical protein [Calditrichota bacterium]
MTSVLLFGICGRMGRLSAETIADAVDLSLAGGIERPDHPDVGSQLCGVEVLADGGALPTADVWLDFSLAGAAIEHSRRAAEWGKPLIVAATGFGPEIEAHWKEISRFVPFLIAPNLSSGARVLETLAIQGATLLGGEYDIALSELHHKAKADAPSGTAHRIAARVEAATGTNVPIVSQRGGGATGEHVVRFLGADEEVILIHRAWSRKAFISGIAGAVRFIVKQAPGLYSMNDLPAEA